MAIGLIHEREKRVGYWLFGTASIAMTVIWWLVMTIVPGKKVDSALQVLPVLAPQSWIVLWLLISLGLGIAASVKRRLWLIAPCLVLATAITFSYRILD